MKVKNKEANKISAVWRKKTGLATEGVSRQLT
jgi:hypothetical protein